MSRCGGPAAGVPGEAPVSARLTDGPIRDLNVMTRRGAATHHVALLRPGQRVGPDVVALFGHAPGTRIGEVALDPGDCVIAAPDAPLTTAGRQAEVIAIAVRFAGSAPHGTTG